MTTGEAIRKFCKECVNSIYAKDRKDCGGEFVLVTQKPCPLFKYRFRGKGTLTAIRRNCVECMGGSFKLVEECETESCHLWSFRFGKHPNKEFWRGEEARLFPQDKKPPQSRVTVRGSK